MEGESLLLVGTVGGSCAERSASGPTLGWQCEWWVRALWVDF